VDRLFPAVTMLSVVSSIEVNFGDDKAKPFEYDIKNCPGLGLDCIWEDMKWSDKNGTLNFEHIFIDFPFVAFIKT
jgi:hypothetical protein